MPKTKKKPVKKSAKKVVAKKVSIKAPKKVVKKQTAKLSPYIKKAIVSKKKIVKKPQKKWLKWLIILAAAVLACGLLFINNQFLAKYANNSGVLGANWAKAFSITVLNPSVGEGKVASLTNFINSADYTWSSSDPDVLSVVKIQSKPDSAYVYGLRVGEATITVKSSDGLTDTKRIKVNENRGVGLELTNGLIANPEKVDNITVYEEKGCNRDAVKEYKKDLKELPYHLKYFSSLYFITNKNFKLDTVKGLTLINRVYIPCSDPYWFPVMAHEAFHAYDNAYAVFIGENNQLSDQKDAIALFNKYKKLYKQGKIFKKDKNHDNAFISRGEFFPQMYYKYFHKYISTRYSKDDKAQIVVPDDLKDFFDHRAGPITTFLPQDLVTKKIMYAIS